MKLLRTIKLKYIFNEFNQLSNENIFIVEKLITLKDVQNVYFDYKNNQVIKYEPEFNEILISYKNFYKPFKYKFGYDLKTANDIFLNFFKKQTNNNIITRIITVDNLEWLR